MPKGSAKCSKQQQEASESTCDTPTKESLLAESNQQRTPKQSKEDTSSCQSEDRSPKKVFEKPSDRDVVFGRGTGVANHPGNKRFRALISNYRHVYNRVPRNKKIEIAAKIVDQVHAQHGHFLQKQVTNGGEHAYATVLRKRALEKAAQGLREKRGANRSFLIYPDCKKTKKVPKKGSSKASRSSRFSKQKHHVRQLSPQMTEDCAPTPQKTVGCNLSMTCSTPLTCNSGTCVPSSIPSKELNVPLIVPSSESSALSANTPSPMKVTSTDTHLLQNVFSPLMGGTKAPKKQTKQLSNLLQEETIATPPGTNFHLMDESIITTCWLSPPRLSPNSSPTMQRLRPAVICSSPIAPTQRSRDAAYMFRRSSLLSSPSIESLQVNRHRLIQPTVLDFDQAIDEKVKFSPQQPRRVSDVSIQKIQDCNDTPGHDETDSECDDSVYDSVYDNYDDDNEEADDFEIDMDTYDASWQLFDFCARNGHLD